MGCGGSKSSVEHMDSRNSDRLGPSLESDAASPEEKWSPEVRRPSYVVPMGLDADDLQAEMLAETNGQHAVRENNVVVGQAMAFEIPFDDKESRTSLIMKHPPHRLQRLGDVPIGAPSLKDLQEKQALAEHRRQQILLNRIQSAKNRSSRRPHPHSTDQEQNSDDLNL